jgi:hypothetical protein
MAKWDEIAGGFEVYHKGTDWRISCPKCVKNFIVYNGNHFCSGYNSGECKWALPHPVKTKLDKSICDSIGIDYG